MAIQNDGNSTKIPKRLQIVEAAFKLFKTNGFYATGVDLIMRNANVSKRTMYKYFPSKNDLIVAVLDYYRSTYKDHLQLLLDHDGMNNQEKILAIFDDAMGWFEETNFHGCLAVNAMAEFAGKDQAIEDSCLCFKRWEIEVLSNLTKELDANSPDELAYKLFVLLEGMSAIAQVVRGVYPVDMTKMANEVIEAHLIDHQN